MATEQKPRVPQVFKNVISPVQSWLLSQGRCVGCGRELSSAKAKKRTDNSQLVTCECGRVFVKENNKYRRALLSEV